jgi:hypothetical protein
MSVFAQVPGGIVSDDRGGTVSGTEPGDRDRIGLDGRSYTQRRDGGWAYCFVIDGGYNCNLAPVQPPRGYYDRFSDGGWAVVEFLPDGGTLRMWPVKPAGY